MLCCGIQCLPLIGFSCGMLSLAVPSLFLTLLNPASNLGCKVWSIPGCSQVLKVC